MQTVDNLLHPILAQNKRRMNFERLSLLAPIGPISCTYLLALTLPGLFNKKQATINQWWPVVHFKRWSQFSVANCVFRIAGSLFQLKPSPKPTT
ncbi:MAG: hypothetical protein JW953_09875 [Anaerolineae bacterium]|nr:hypothetical protein [Anaerolineae bacterium]